MHARWITLVAVALLALLIPATPVTAADTPCPAKVDVGDGVWPLAERGGPEASAPPGVETTGDDRTFHGGCVYLPPAGESTQEGRERLTFQVWWSESGPTEAPFFCKPAQRSWELARHEHASLTHRAFVAWDAAFTGPGARAAGADIVAALAATSAGACVEPQEPACPLYDPLRGEPLLKAGDVNATATPTTLTCTFGRPSENPDEPPVYRLVFAWAEAGGRAPAGTCGTAATPAAVVSPTHAARVAWVDVLAGHEAAATAHARHVQHWPDAWSAVCADVRTEDPKPTPLGGVVALVALTAAAFVSRRQA